MTGGLFSNHYYYDNNPNYCYYFVIDFCKASSLDICESWIKKNVQAHMNADMHMKWWNYMNMLHSLHLFLILYGEEKGKEKKHNQPQPKKILLIWFLCCHLEFRTKGDVKDLIQGIVRHDCKNLSVDQVKEQCSIWHTKISKNSQAYHVQEQMPQLCTVCSCFKWISTFIVGNFQPILRGILNDVINYIFMRSNNVITAKIKRSLTSCHSLDQWNR